MRTIIAFAGLIAMVCADCACAQAPVPYNAAAPGPAVQYYPPGSVPVGTPAISGRPAQSGPEMYDHSYRGPYNSYGQPVYSAQSQQQAQANGQLPPGYDGAIPQALQGLGSLGGYFWSYLPAPLRGVEESTFMPGPGSGRTSVIFVPGYR